MMKIIKNRSRLPYLFKISQYLLIFSILCNCLYLPCYFYMLKLNRENIRESYQSILDSQLQAFDSSMNSIISLSNLIKVDSTYDELFYISEPYIRNNRLNMLRQETKTHTIIPYDFICNFGLVLNREVLFTRSNIYFNREFLSSDYYLSYPENYFDEFSGQIFFLPSQQFVSDSKEYDAFTFGIGLSTKNKLYLYVHYSLSELTSYFTNEQFIDYGCLSVYCGDTLLASQGNLPDGDFASFSSSSNVNSGLRIDLQLSNSYIDNDLTYFYQLAMVFLFLLLIMICFWSVIFALRLSQPLYTISNILNENGFDIHKNSIMSLSKDLQKMGTQFSDNKRRLDKYQKNCQIQLLEKALYKGLYNENEQFFFEEIFNNFPANWQLVFISYFSNKDMAIESHSIYVFLINIIEQHLPDTIVYIYDSNTLLLFSPVSKTDSLDEKLNNISKCAEATFFISVNYTISRTYTHYTQLYEALQDLEQQVALFPLKSQKTLQFTIQHLEHMYTTLKSGNDQVAISILQSLDIYTNNFNTINLSEAKSIYQIINYLLIQLKIETNLLEISIPKFNPAKVKALFETELPQCFHSFAEEIKQGTIDQKQSLNLQIIEFIHKNIENQQLCISMVTDHFHISAPTLQKHMINIYGKTFSSYVEKIRMELAEQLLQDRTLSIQDIAYRIGYTNKNSFHKAFKRYFGRAPRAKVQE